MQFEFFPLSRWSWSEITDCFNQAFADYVVKVTATAAYLEQRAYAARVDLSCSVGAVRAGEFCGLMLLGVDDWHGHKTAFNVGTGVLPVARENRLVMQMYDWLMPRFRAAKVTRLGLEVITTNPRAIAAYRRVGFESKRDLFCYLGKPKIQLPVSDVYQFAVLEKPRWDLYQHLPAIDACWEHTRESICRQPALRTMEVSEANGVQAVAVYHPETGAVPEFRFSSLDSGLFLFSALADRLNQVKPNNIPATDQRTQELLDSIGLECYIKQFEMWREMEKE